MQDCDTKPPGDARYTEEFNMSARKLSVLSQESSMFPTEGSLTIIELLQFARQITLGMVSDVMFQITISSCTIVI